MAPKAFISYSWSSDEHQDWVLRLASELRENGVDVTLDKWDLKEGNDAVAFMERMVTDPTVTKVIVILDKKYAERADSRKGGVGTETQIISAEVYAKADQNKFVGVIAEKNEQGQAYLPAYYKSRIYIDLSESESYGKNFEQLLRWIYDKPLHVKPILGKEPEFLTENAVVLGTQSRARRAADLARAGAQNASGALDEYLETFVSELEKFRLLNLPRENADDLIVESIENSLPYRNEFVETISTVARFWPFDVGSALHKFFESVAAYMFHPSTTTSWTSIDFDNFKFIIHELFLYAIAILIRNERFNTVAKLLEAGYYLGEAAPNSQQPMADFGIFRTFLQSLQIRNSRLKLNRISVQADLLEKRSHSSGVPFSALMQADFVLFLRSSVAADADQMRQWFPDTLVYSTRQYGPFEIFARAESASYFDKIAPMLDVASDDELKGIVAKMGRGPNSKLYVPDWQHQSIDVNLLANTKRLASRG